MPLWLDKAFLAAVDAAFALRAPPLPSRAQLEHSRIVSHRGERDDVTVFENTYAAFDSLRGSGVHGIEFDIRWTKDLVPVVFHDADLRRLFGDGTRIADLTRAELARRRPEIPDLQAFVRRYVDEFHLMAEIKLEPYPDAALQGRRLAEALAPALERRRVHVLSLVPAMFAQLPALPAGITMGVARLNAGEISREALASRRGGFASHYAALGAERIAAHQAAGQVVGCGFPASRNVLLREIARGVDYVFTNRAREAEGWRREALAQPAGGGTPAPRG